MTDLEKIISYFKQISKIPRTSGDWWRLQKNVILK